MKTNQKKDKQSINFGKREDILAWAKVFGQMALVSKVVEEIIKLFI